MKKLIAALLMACSLAAHGQKYTVVSASSGGDIGDLIRHAALARIPHVHEPSPGGGGLIAPSKFAAKPRGSYLLLSGLMTQQVVGPRLHPERAKYTDDDLKPVTMLASTFFVLMAHPRTGFSRGRVAVSGSNAEFVAGLIARATGQPLSVVPYKGIAQGVLDAVRGDVELALVQAGTAAPFVQSGQLRAVGITAPVRSAGFPGVPAFAEMYPGFSVEAAFGLYGQSHMTDSEALQLAAKVRSAVGAAASTYRQNHLSPPAEFTPRYLTQFVGRQRVQAARAGLQ